MYEQEWKMIDKLKDLQEISIHEYDGKIRVGMPLVDKDAVLIGLVKEIREDGFIVRRLEIDLPVLFIPFSVCIRFDEGVHKLKIAKKEIEQQDWCEGFPVHLI